MAMNLAAVTDINRVVHMLNEGNYDISPEQFYDKMLLDTIKLGQEHYVHLAHTESFTLPAGTKKIQKRRWGGLTAHTTPLQEGIPPMPDKTSMESITFTATTFGRYMEFSDRVNLDQIDPIIAHYTKELGDVMSRTLERYARETFLSAASKMYASNKTSVGSLIIGDKIYMEDLRFAVLRMSRLLVKPMDGGYYNYICSPEFLYDLIDDPLVEKYMTINQTTKNLYEDGKPFPLFQIKFIPTMLDEFYTPDLDHPGEYYTGSAYALRVYSVDASGNYWYRNIAASGNRTTGASYLHDGTYIPSKISWTIPDPIATNTMLKVEADGTETTITVVASGATGNQINVADCDGWTWVELPVHKGILFGKESLVKINIEGQDGVKTFVQPLGSAGTNDPLHQRQSIGCKINSIGYGILRDEAIVVTYSVPSQAAFTSYLTSDVVKMAQSVTADGVAADAADEFIEDAAGATLHDTAYPDREDLTDGTALDYPPSGV